MPVFHVCSTAAHDRPVFEDPEVVTDFFRALQAVSDAGVRIVAYALMSSHVHLLIEVEEEAELSRAMNRVLGRTAKNLNRRLQQRGGIFCHRFWRMPAESEAYRWILPLYVHANPAPHTTDLRRLNVGLRSSQAAWVSGDGPGWLSPGALKEQYADDYLSALQEYLEGRKEPDGRPLSAAAACTVAAVARVCGVRPATLRKAARGGRRDRMLLAWALGRECGVVQAARVLEINRATAARWVRCVEADPTFSESRARLGSRSPM